MCGSAKICRPGCISSARIINERNTPTRPPTIANTRYIVPMSLWFVEQTKRRQLVEWLS
jgi:hypothetical protein